LALVNSPDIQNAAWVVRILYSSNTPRQSIEKLVVGERGEVCLKEHSKSLLCNPSSLLACRGFKAVWASGQGSSTWRLLRQAAADSAARNGRQISAAQRYCCSSPWFSIDVGTSILESLGLYTQVASYKNMNSLNDGEIPPNQKYPISGIMALKWRKVMIFESSH
jgi:hypothetical protein